ncbi:MAG TPA: TetR/AcrR family transcriptional regulator [Anaerolineales bacterium]|nr:TetR/AcrR family transcriptional regulator [Anaerolineales bacterium]
MAFGKKGRPPEDVLARRREIYEAVSPLIFQLGARRLSMRQAAKAACLSVGGLYHYFPTKRDLVLHGLSLEALARLCQDFHDEYADLAERDPEAFFEKFLDFSVWQVNFLRPAVHAALEIGMDAFWEVMDTALNLKMEDLTTGLRLLVPDGDDRERENIGRAIRRTICAALMDRTVTSIEIRQELGVLVDGYRARAGQALLASRPFASAFAATTAV